MKKLLLILMVVSLVTFISCTNDTPNDFSANPITLAKKGGGGNGGHHTNPPPEPTTLTLRNNIHQIAVSTYEGAVRVWSWRDGNFQSDGVLGGSDYREAIALGDIDHDGNKELVTTHRYNDGHGRNKTRHLVLEVYESGTNTPSRVSEDLIPGGQATIMALKIGDADNDGENELLIVGRDYLQIFQDNGNEIALVWETPIDNDFGYSGEIADANNDGLNEVIYSSLLNGYFKVFEYLADLTWGNMVVSEPVGGALDIAQVMDVDGDGLNEIIGGGNQSQLYVWEDTGNGFQLNFTSPTLDGFTQGVAAGDFDGDGLNEIAVGTAHTSGSAYVYKFDGITYSQVFQGSLSAGVDHVVTCDLNDDSRDEFVYGTGTGISVFTWSGEYLELFTDDFGEEVSDIDCN